MCFKLRFLIFNFFVPFCFPPFFSYKERFQQFLFQTFFQLCQVSLIISPHSRRHLSPLYLHNKRHFSLHTIPQLNKAFLEENENVRKESLHEFTSGFVHVEKNLALLCCLKVPPNELRIFTNLQFAKAPLENMSFGKNFSLFRTRFHLFC
uniref:(northern house mosquito) hypothetical protein n=1 Tax=Culex pipiens TaxID=7175 RepID=A0A8D8MKE1_CULPI